MKVIKAGRKKATMRVICDGCGAELEIRAKDIKHDETYDIFDPSMYYKCPCCRCKNYLRFKNLTEEMYMAVTKSNY